MHERIGKLYLSNLKLLVVELQCFVPHTQMMGNWLLLVNTHTRINHLKNFLWDLGGQDGGIRMWNTNGPYIRPTIVK